MTNVTNALLGHQSLRINVGVKSRKKLQNKLYLVVGVANLAATIAIVSLTSSSRRNKAHGKGTKLPRPAGI